MRINLINEALMASQVTCDETKIIGVRKGDNSFTSHHDTKVFILHDEIDDGLEGKDEDYGTHRISGFTTVDGLGSFWVSRSPGLNN